MEVLWGPFEAYCGPLGALLGAIRGEMNTIEIMLVYEFISVTLHSNICSLALWSVLEGLEPKRARSARVVLVCIYVCICICVCIGVYIRVRGPERSFTVPGCVAEVGIHGRDSACFVVVCLFVASSPAGGSREGSRAGRRQQQTTIIRAAGPTSATHPGTLNDRSAPSL